MIFHDIGVAAAYQSEFDQLKEGIFGARSPKLTTSDPLTLDIEERGADHVFPGQQSRAAYCQ